MSKRSSPKRDECECGRLRADASKRHYRSGEVAHVYYRCECGREWTIDEAAPDPRDPVSAEEVVEVHEFFKQFERPLSELLDEPE